MFDEKIVLFVLYPLLYFMETWNKKKKKKKKKTSSMTELSSPFGNSNQRLPKAGKIIVIPWKYKINKIK